MKPNKSKREKSTTTVGHYVRNADLLPAVIEAKEKGEVTDKLITMIGLIADNYSKKWRFANYSYREDMVSAAVENLCKNALKFDAVKYNNPFSYYTSAIHNSFLQYISDEKKHRTIRDKLLIDAGVNPSFGYNELTADGISFDSDDLLSADISTPNSAFDEGQVAKDVVNEGQEDAELKENDAEDIKYDRIGNREKAPGKVTVFAASEVYFDPIRGIYVKKTAEGQQS